MSKLLRYFQPGQSCFITSVTAGRNPILIEHANLLTRGLCRAKRKSNITIVAWVILPDHFHLLVDSPDGRVGQFMHLVKLSFSYQLKNRSPERNPIWQHRYWDHIIRSEADNNAHIDYIHYNPVKHGLCDNPDKWRYLSLRDFCRRGLYAPDWGAAANVKFDGIFGE